MRTIQHYRLFACLLCMYFFLTAVDAQWSRLNSGTSLWLRGVDFITPMDGLVVGYDGTILLTQDGGDNWILRSSGTNLDLLSVFYADAQTVYCTGALGLVLKSVDGGFTWSTVKEGGAVTHECFFLTPDLGYIAGEGGQVFKTINGGQTWVRLPVGIAGKVALHFIDEEIGFFVGLGSEDAIIKTTNGGLDFVSLNPFGFEEYGSVYFTTSSVGYVLGIGSQRIIKTLDGGATWRDVIQNAGAKLYDITFASEKFGQVVGGFPNSSIILRTEDAGENWLQENSGVSDPLFDCEMISDEYGFAVGMNGTILRRGEVPTSISGFADNVLQIYPNPASDHIYLNVDLPGDVEFRIYDLHGVEINMGTFKRKLTLSISTLETGFYFIKFENEKSTSVLRFEKI